MYSITLRKLPGSKKEFAHVKSVVDNRRPGSSKAPSVPAMQNKPDDNKPSSGRAVSEKEIARPLTVQIRPPWNSSTKIERTPDLYIKPLPGTRIGHVQFKARSVPEKNVQPFRPVLPSKTRQPTRKPKADDESVAGQKNQENKLVEDVNIRNPVEMTPVSPQQAPHEINEIPEKAADVSAGSADPGLMSRMWHSMVDPILNSKKPDDEGAGDDEEVAVKQPEFEAPPVTEEPGVPAMTGAESPASEERVFPSVAENKKDGSPEMAIEAVRNQPTEGPSSAEGEGKRKFPPGYGSKKERIRKALEKKGIMPCDELPPKSRLRTKGESVHCHHPLKKSSGEARWHTKFTETVPKKYGSQPYESIT
ncbi:hypothetical protein OUZ56_012834 [Daphnia magna]|uniref:Uncharacterized protein n=1 Tax=Daphnia magna TaxID=35525 RepID=A0ABQ9Z468_9CRUS|nr:hypothetical protein OUZ56_012834 [Daphnia magna]